MLARTQIIWVSFASLLILAGCDQGAIDPPEPDEGSVVEDVVDLDVGTDLPTPLLDDTNTDSGEADIDIFADEGVEITEDVEVVEDSSDAQAEVVEDIVVDAGPQPCDPPLTVDPPVGYALQNKSIHFVPSGGTGSYRFEVVENQSSCMISELTGFYFGGLEAGVVDTLSLSDEGCVGSLEFEAHIVRPMEVSPSSIEIPPNSSFTFVMSEGSGSFGFEMLLALSGGTVDESGAYTSGDEEDVDLLVVRDLLTGESLEISINVTSVASLRPTPAMVFVPAGESARLEVEGGSGFYSFSVDDPSITMEGATISGEGPFAAVVQVNDDFLDLSTEINVITVQSLSMDLPRAGFGTSTNTLVGPGDINDDGFPDMVLGRYEASVGTVRSGAVYVYAGIDGGMNPDPVQVLTTNERRARMGNSVAVKDLDGDGNKDLVVGVHFGGGFCGISPTYGSCRKGRVEIYSGVAGGFFEEAPSHVWNYKSDSAEFGWTVEVCDFNGDGFQDVAVGARYDENLAAMPIVYNYGRIHIFSGSAEGFEDSPSQIIDGKLLNGSGAWTIVQNSYFPRDTTVGDLDNDGRCDLVASSDFNSDGGVIDGAIMVYKGQSTDESNSNSLSPTPVLLYGNQQSESWKDGHIGGTQVTVGDLNDDGLLEILTGEHYFSNCANLDPCPGADLTRNGRSWLIPGGTLPDEAATDWIHLDDVGTFYLGPNNWNMEGWSGDIGDVNGDGIGDFLGVSLLGLVDGWEGGGGSLRVYHGNTEGMPSTEASWSVGGSYQERAGNKAVIVGDLDGDGVAEIGAFADHADDFGHWVGRAYLYFSDVEKGRTALNLPGEASDGRFGGSLAIIPDLNGDGLTELAVGAEQAGYNLYPDVATWAEEVRAGSVQIYLGTPTGFEMNPIQVLKGFTGHGAHDYIGTGLADVGDFDGDGHPDLAVSAVYEDRPASFDETLYHGATTCGGALGNSGGVYIFRGTGHAESFTDEDGNGLYDAGEPFEDTNESGTFEPAFELQPAFVYYGPQAGQGIYSIAGGINTNNDGYDDLIVSSNYWDTNLANPGGVHLVQGRIYEGAGKVQVICSPDFEYYADTAGDEMGVAAAVGDLNGDGCDEFAVGARYDEKTGWSRGGVRLFYGWGDEVCAFETPMMKRYEPVANGSLSGASLSSGDVDGDGLPDLVVGGIGFRDGINQIGAAWVVQGSYLEMFIDGVELFPAYEAESGGNPSAWPFLLPINEENFIVNGSRNAEHFGSAVAVFEYGGGAGIAVGRANGALGGDDGSGGVSLYRYIPGGGLETESFAHLVGETGHPGSYLGRNMVTTTRPGGTLIVVGAYEGKGVGLDGGSVYPVFLPNPE